MPRRLPKGQETRERILGVALREFASRGYGNVAIEDVARAAGLTKGAVYYWFADKDDLGRELQHQLYERLTSVALASLSLDADTVTNMRRAFEAYMDALGDLGEARFFLRDAWVIPVLDEAGRRDRESALAMIRGILASAVRRGEIVALDPDALARVLVAAWDEATLHQLRTGSRAETTAVIDHVLESLRASAHDESASPIRRRAT